MLLSHGFSGKGSQGNFGKKIIILRGKYSYFGLGEQSLFG
jgi:hypothetical protein